MVKNYALTDFSSQKNLLLGIITKKVISRKYSTLNQDFDKDLKIDLPAITNLLDTILIRIRTAEMIYYTYLESADHAMLASGASNVPVQIEVEFTDGTAIYKKTIEINDKAIYKETVDMNFQQFILIMAALFENFVRLSELLIKKIIVHRPESKPISAPLHHYLSYFESLIKLGYRKNDFIYGCILTHLAKLDAILVPINTLRNKFIHGFQSGLISDGFTYNINHDFTPKISKGAPVLNIDRFSDVVLRDCKLFFSDLLTALTSQIKHHSKFIPA